MVAHVPVCETQREREIDPGGGKERDFHINSFTEFKTHVCCRQSSMESIQACVEIVWLSVPCSVGYRRGEEKVITSVFQKSKTRMTAGVLKPDPKT